MTFRIRGGPVASRMSAGLSLHCATLRRSGAASISLAAPVEGRAGQTDQAVGKNALPVRDQASTAAHLQYRDRKRTDAGPSRRWRWRPSLESHRRSSADRDSRITDVAPNTANIAVRIPVYQRVRRPRSVVDRQIM